MSKIMMLALAGGLMACGGDACEKASDRVEAVLADCGVETSTSTSASTTDATTTTDAVEEECTDELADNWNCQADCYEAADCTAFDGSDMEGGLALFACVVECGGLTTTGTTNTGTTTTGTTTGTTTM